MFETKTSFIFFCTQSKLYMRKSGTCLRLNQGFSFEKERKNQRQKIKFDNEGFSSSLKTFKKSARTTPKNLIYFYWKINQIFRLNLHLGPRNNLSVFCELYKIEPKNETRKSLTYFQVIFTFVLQTFFCLSVYQMFLSWTYKLRRAAKTLFFKVKVISPLKVQAIPFLHHQHKHHDIQQLERKSIFFHDFRIQFSRNSLT